MSWPWQRLTVAVQQGVDDAVGMTGTEQRSGLWHFICSGSASIRTSCVGYCIADLIGRYWELAIVLVFETVYQNLRRLSYIRLHRLATSEQLHSIHSLVPNIEQLAWPSSIGNVLSQLLVVRSQLAHEGAAHSSLMLLNCHMFKRCIIQPSIGGTSTL